MTFLEMARKTPIYFKERDSTTMHLQVNGAAEDYEILRVIEFTSARKCMTVVARCNGGKVFAFVKGADSVIMNKLAE